VSIGSMIDVNEQGRSPLWYAERRLNAYKPIQNGFLLLDEGVPYLFNESGSSSLNGSKPWSYWERGE